MDWLIFISNIGMGFALGVCAVMVFVPEDVFKRKNRERRDKNEIPPMITGFYDKELNIGTVPEGRFKLWHEK